MTTNTTDQTEQANDHVIKFTHGTNGVIETNNGNTVFSNLFMLGAFANTRVNVFGKGTAAIKYATDTAGLEILELRTEDTLACLSSAVNALGTIMANVNIDELDKGTLHSYGWLIAGLGELMGQVAFEARELATARRLAKPVKNEGQVIA